MKNLILAAPLLVLAFGVMMACNGKGDHAAKDTPYDSVADSTHRPMVSDIADYSSLKYLHDQPQQHA